MPDADEPHFELITLINHPRSRPRTEDLEALPVLSQGQADDCHYEGEDDHGPLAGVRFRIWLSRTGRADGEPFNNTVTVEEFSPVSGQWATRLLYDGDRPTITVPTQED